MSRDFAMLLEHLRNKTGEVELDVSHSVTLR
jgi:hypothetical protein